MALESAGQILDESLSNIVPMMPARVRLTEQGRKVCRRNPALLTPRDFEVFEWLPSGEVWAYVPSGGFVKLEPDEFEASPMPPLTSGG